MDPWPATPAQLEEVQRHLGAVSPPPWHLPEGPWTAAGCFVCFARGTRGPGAPGDRGWAAAVVVRGETLLAACVVRGAAGARYTPGLLALREGPLLEEAINGLPQRPEVLVVNGTGRDHPRRAGLALHLGARLALPSIGVTHRPLLAQGSWPLDEDGATDSLVLDGDVVGYWLRPRRGVRPLVVHAAWRTTPQLAVSVVLALCHGTRTPDPLRYARRAAREARSADQPAETRS